MRSASTVIIVAAVLFSAFSSAIADDRTASRIEFNRDVRPILVDVCYHCHGPDKAQRKAGLRLDLEDAAKAVHEGRAAIVAGKPDRSELVRRIMSHGEDQMPPANSGRSLSPTQKEVLTKWIEQGATWQKHWAFIPPVKPELPKVGNEKWVRNPIDRFILAKLEGQHIAPSPEAAKTTLIRRLAFDLTGLPPTVEEVNAFVNDDSPQAYEKLVDRLLASPRYGERMGWRWLEAARYADTSGYQTDGERDMWRWRDWVIEAYNRNMPFDQFTIEQIAGDLLPEPTLDQRIATGFNRNHRGNSEGGIVPEEYAVEYVVDRVETTATVWLGLTLGCARCHEHKFDPFSQKEFYQLYAYFNSVPEKGRAVKLGNSPPFIKAPTIEQKRKLTELMLENVEAVIVAANLAKSFPIWLEKKNLPAGYDWAPNYKQQLAMTFDDAGGDNIKAFFRDGLPSFKSGIHGKAADLDGVRFIDAGDVGNFGFQDKFSFSFWLYPRKRSGVIVSRMAEEPQSEGYSVNLVNGKLQVHLTKRWLDDALRVESERTFAADEWRHVVVTYDGSREAKGVRVYIDGRNEKTKTLLDELNQTFKNDEPFRIGSGGGKDSRFDGLIDELRIYSRSLDDDEAKILAVPERVGELVRMTKVLTEVQKKKLENCYRSEHASPAMKRSYRNIIRVREQLEAFQDSIPTVMVMEELPNPRDAYILIRGEYDKHGEKVSRAIPAALNPFPKNAPNNRLGLARWLVDPANPLTARVAVNRMWQLHFGTGLVKTGWDFGTQGEYPSHPELLDWLATEFIRTGWDVKKMHKTIVMSAAYRQSSRLRNSEPGAHADDVDNRLISRGPRYRLSAEMLRDQALFASGLLVEKQGGPSVKPYQPPGLWKELTGSDDYTPDKGEGLYRRSLYTFWKRTVAPPSLMTFDAATRESCCVRESRTNTPLQALSLLNDVCYVEAARGLAQRVLKVAKATPGERLTRAFQLVTARVPRENELQILEESLVHHLREYRASPAAARKLLRIGDSKVDANLDVAELAAYAEVCSLILNLDEALTKE